jgi:nitrogen fixation protein
MIQTSESHEGLAEALQQAQKEFPSLAKTKQVGVGNFGYSYLPLEQMLSLVTPVLLKNGLCISQGFGCSPTGQTLIVTRLFHKSGAYIKSELPIFLPERDMANPKKNQTHLWGGAVTYQRRYSIKLILGLETDMDFNMEEEEKVQEKKINKGEVIETLREQVKEISNNSDTEKTYQLAKGAINTAKSVEQLTDFKKNIAIRFAKGKLTLTQKEELETLIVNKKKVLE